MWTQRRSIAVSAASHENCPSTCGVPRALFSTLFALVALGCKVALLLGAPPPNRATADLLRDSYGTSEGLPQSTVRSLTRTTDGYVLAATQARMSRFDGVRFRNFQMRNSPGLPQDNIHVVAAGRDGSLWVGTYTQGVVRYRHDIFEPIHGLSNMAINAIVEDREGAIWIGTAHGLNVWRGGAISSLSVADGLAGNTILALAEDFQGRLWVATDGGLSLLDHGKPRPFAASAALAGHAVVCLTVAHDNSIWLSSGRLLFHIQDEKVVKQYGPENLPTQNPITSLVEDTRGALWIGTWGDGLLRLRDRSFAHYGTAEGLPNGTIHCLLAEKDGSFWVGTNAGGMSRLRPREIFQIGSPEGLSDSDADAVLEAQDGSVWIATQGRGLNRYRDGHIRTYMSSDGLATNVVLAIAEGHHGTIWAGTTEGGLTG